MKFLKGLFMALFLFILPSCIHVEIKGAGVFDGARSRNDEVYILDVPIGIYGKVPQGLSYDPGDGSKVELYHIGRCGAQLSFTGIMVPIIPFWLPNSCRSKGFYIEEKWSADLLGISYQLHYNSKTHNPYIDNNSIKFKIENFSEFKHAKDKTLIIHKKKLNGTIFTKELPFEWKTVVEVSGGL